MDGSCWHYDEWWEQVELKAPCKGKNSNICVAEGCFGFACLKKEN